MASTASTDSLSYRTNDSVLNFVAVTDAVVDVVRGDNHMVVSTGGISEINYGYSDIEILNPAGARGKEFVDLAEGRITAKAMVSNPVSC